MVVVKRTLTLLIAIPLISSIIYWGSENIFLVIAILAAGTALFEYLSFNLPGSTLLTRFSLVIPGVLSIVFVRQYFQRAISINGSQEIEWLLPSLLVVLTVGAFAALIRKFLLFPAKLAFQDNISVASIGIVYICIFLSYLVLIRNRTDGVDWIFFVLIVLWMGDTGAYIVGSLMGSRKLCPRISPNKTVEGALAGLLFSLLAGLVCKHLFLTELTVTHCLLLTGGIACMEQLGDLCESIFKRERGVKDSGSLLPGHGGMLDRIDSLLFAAPLLYYYIAFLLD